MRFLLPLCLLFAATACSDTDPLPPLEPKAVIEGWIDSDGYPRVIFTSAFIEGEENVSIADKLIRWGTVRISDGSKSVIMTGGPDEDLFPPYSFFTYEMKGTPGTTYTITADYKELHAEASCTMPEPPDVAEVIETPIEGSDTLRAVSIRIANPSAERAYYHVSTRVLPDETRYLPAIMGCAEAEPGQTVTLPVFRGKTSISDADFVPQLPSNRAVLVRVERVTPAVYAFWQAFNEATMFGGSIFVGNNSSLPGNISGGFGIWSAQGTHTIRLHPAK